MILMMQRERFQVPPADIVMAIITLVLGVIVIAGWLFDIATLKQLQPGLTQMKANTAISFTIFGISLLALRWGRGRRSFYCMNIVTAIALMLLGMLTLSEFIFSWESGLSNLFIHDHGGALAGNHPGQMTFDTALAFTVLAICLLLISMQKFWLLTQCLSAAIIGLAYLALFSYMFSELPHSYITSGASMAVHTAFGLLCAAFGVLVLTSEYGLMIRIKAQFQSLAFLFAVLMMTASGIGAYQRSMQGNLITSNLTSAHKMQEHLDDIQADINVMVASEYGFITTRQPFFLEPVSHEKESLTNLLRSIKSLGSEELTMVDVDEIDGLVRGRIHLVDRAMDIALSDGSQAAIVEISDLSGEGMDVQLRQAIRKAKRGIQEFIAQNQEKESIINSSGMVSLGLTGISGFALMLIVLFSQQRQLIERKISEEAIRTLAFYDPLTKLPNRRLVLERLQRVLNGYRRERISGALFYLDLDNFKNLNDIRGHQVGDELLVSVAARIKHCVRADDTVARLGGDEFVVLIESLPEGTEGAASAAKNIAEKIIAELALPYDLSGGAFSCSASLGIAIFDTHTSELSEVIAQADMAMYAAKHAGKNAVCFFDGEMQKVIERRASLESDLKRAMDSAEFRLYYQVQVDHYGVPGAAEALIRWQHPEKGMIGPVDFIPFAEQTGLILDLGAWVLETACAQLADWRSRALFTDFSISVNVSAQQFYHENFIQTVSSAMQRYHLRAGDLKLEITESILLNEMEVAVTRMTALKKLGVLLAMDDFGTGFSSLSYLRELPFDQIKIDKSFVSGVQDPASKNALLIRSIVGIGVALGMDVLTEGVEAETEYDAIRNLGCKEFQGYLFGKPLSAEDFEKRYFDVPHMQSEREYKDISLSSGG